MRTKLIICLLTILILMTCIFITSGIGDGNFGIESFVKLQQKTAELNAEVYDLQAKNTSEYKIKMQELLDAVSDYKKQKENYESLIPLVQGVGDKENKSFDLYDIDFLWTIIGNYATEDGIELQFDVSKVSNDVSFLNTDYILCDLKFTVLGEYISIVDFIYDLEDDERLNFEIRNFTMNKEGEKLQAKFVVKSIPINKTNLSIVAQ